MSLMDRTNESIPLSMTLGHADDGTPGELMVDADFDSSLDPQHRVVILWTDEYHDSEIIKLTYDEAGLLHDRLGLILGRSS